MLNQFITKQWTFLKGCICIISQEKYENKHCYLTHISLYFIPKERTYPDFQDFHSFVMNLFSISISCWIIVLHSIQYTVHWAFTRGEYLWVVIYGSVILLNEVLQDLSNILCISGEVNMFEFNSIKHFQTNNNDG